jgi:phosphatidylglycerophosphate synthase
VSASWFDDSKATIRLRRYDADPVIAILPWLLIAARAAATLILAAALAERVLGDRLVFWLFVVAFVSDYFDGVIARALNVVTRRLRQADSLVDTVFYVVLAVATWTLHPEVLGGTRWRWASASGRSAPGTFWM